MVVKNPGLMLQDTLVSSGQWRNPSHGRGGSYGAFERLDEFMSTDRSHDPHKSHTHHQTEFMSSERSRGRPQSHIHHQKVRIIKSKS